MLRAAAASVDITPEPGIEIIGYGARISTGVRDPLEAAVLVLDHDRDRIVLVTLDLPGIDDYHAAMIENRVALAARTEPGAVIVTASHTHSAPMLGDDRWSTATLDAIDRITEQAVSAMAPATLAIGEAAIDFDINRRLVVDGVSVSRPNPDGPHDSRVRVLRVRDTDGGSIATVVHAVCHPNVMLGPTSPWITADFVGDARALRADPSPWLFLQGAAGDVRPDVMDAAGVEFVEGTSEDVARVGAQLADAVARASEEPVEVDAIAYARVDLALPLLRGGQRALALDALRVGPVLLLTIPGEPFVDIGLDVEGALIAHDPSLTPLIVGYTNGYADYIVTEEARPFGGYEVNRSLLAPGATGTLESALYDLGVSVLDP